MSIGTMTELGWADAARVPIIVVMESSSNPHDSPLVRELATYLVEDLESGISVARCFFNAPMAVKPVSEKPLEPRLIDNHGQQVTFVRSF